MKILVLKLEISKHDLKKRTPLTKIQKKKVSTIRKNQEKREFEVIGEKTGISREFVSNSILKTLNSCAFIHLKEFHDKPIIKANILEMSEKRSSMLLCGSEVFMTCRMGRTAIAPSSIPQYSKNNSSLLSRCQTLVCKVPQVLFKFLQNKSSRVEHSADLTVENKVTGVATPPQISSAQEISQQVERKVNSHLSPEAQCKAKKNIFLRARNCEFINLKIQSLKAKMA
uniref:Uncharacterized protein n=1 Tax=Timema tahoe TaxID=61484 RepID=A0A7R9IFV5_9NEOP|nr:unnamed protein product [Timema tahoe]